MMMPGLWNSQDRRALAKRPRLPNKARQEVPNLAVQQSQRRFVATWCPVWECIAARSLVFSVHEVSRHEKS